MMVREHQLHNLWSLLNSRDASCRLQGHFLVHSDARLRPALLTWLFERAPAPLISRGHVDDLILNLWRDHASAQRRTSGPPLSLNDGSLFVDYGEEDFGFCEWLRFFDNGEVCSDSTERWDDADFRNASLSASLNALAPPTRRALLLDEYFTAGFWSVHDRDLRMYTISPYCGAILYQGHQTPDGLQLAWLSLINGYQEVSLFRTVPVGQKIR